MRALSSLVCILTLFISCSNNSKESKAPGRLTDADIKYMQLSDDFINGYLAWRPQTALNLGFHQYDGKSTDYSGASVEKETQRLKNALQQLKTIDTLSLSAANYYSYRILRFGILNELFSFVEMGAYSNNPMTYASAIDVNSFIKRNFAPLEKRVAYVIAIERNAPAIFKAARENLHDSLPLPYIQLAIEVANGSADFLGGDLVKAIDEVKNDSLKKEFASANAEAIHQIKEYVDYLKKVKLPKAHNHYAIGTNNYQKLLYAGDALTLSPEKILEIGMKELANEQERFNSAAKAIDPTKKPIEVYHDVQKEHPTAEDLIPNAKKHLEEVRQFLIDKKIVTIPSTVRVNVMETPQYLRAVSSASMDTPGPFEEKATEAYYYITPVEKTWSKQQQEDWLTTFDYYTTDNLTIHEAYPGHYTQFLHLNASNADKVEKIFGSYAFIEGWAHYCEIMMVEQKFGNTGNPINDSKYKLTQSGDALLRLCRLCVSIKTHCQGMTVDQATKFFEDNWYQGEKPSRQEALRGTFDPGYLFYTIGKLELLKLRADYQQQEGPNFTLQKFHDQVLDNGMPPIRLLRELLLKDKSTWNATL